jgi:hypothetical protein
MKPLCLTALLSTLLLGCDLYLPGCGSSGTVKELQGATLVQTGLSEFMQIGTILETSGDWKSRTRVCTATLVPKDDFAERYEEAKGMLTQSKGNNLMEFLGKAIATAVLPPKLESPQIPFGVAKDALTGAFRITVDPDDLNELQSLSAGYQLLDLTMKHLESQKEPPEPQSAPNKPI